MNYVYVLVSIRSSKSIVIFTAGSRLFGHLFLKRSIHERVYDLHAREVYTVDWYGNKLMAWNFLRSRCAGWEGGRERGIGVPRRMFGEIFYAFYGIIAYLRVESRERTTVVEKATGISESPAVCASICTYLAAVKR